MKEFDYIILGGGCAGLSLAYSLEINKLDLMTNELMLRNYIFTNQSNKALILVKDLLKRYPENKNYSNILSAISKDLNSKN